MASWCRPAPPGVGADLHAARQRLGWHLPDVATSLRIRLPYLEAIEDGRWSDLPGTAYAVGFIRSYATMLGLDADEVARRFRAEAGAGVAKPRLSFPAPVPQRGVPAGAVVLLGIVVAAGAYVGWLRYSGSDEAKVAQVAAAPPDRLAAMAPLPQSPQVASIIPSGPPAPAAALPPPVIPVPVPVAVAIAPPAPTPLAPVVTTRFVLRAKAGGNVQVEQRLGAVLLNRVMKPGETWPVPTEADLLLTVSNAANLELLVDGKPGQPLGAPGAVLHKLPLDPVFAKAGKPNSTGGRPPR